MKMKKRVSAIIAVMMIAAMVGTAWAEADTKTVDVTYSVPESFTWSVPSDLNFSSNDGDSKILGTVEASQCCITPGKSLEITVASANSFELVSTADENATIGYELHGAEGGFVSLDVSSGMEAGSEDLTVVITGGNPSIAGEFKDTLTFSAEIK